MTPTATYTAVIPSAPPVDAGPVPNPLPRLLAGEDLSAEDSQHLFERLVLGRLEPGEIGGMLIALRMKGETPEEMIGAAQALLAAAEPFDRPDGLFADCCGTGGDGSGTINVSTAAGLVAAAAGLKVAKHGNRSVSSRCGSADVLEALGARIDMEAGQARAVLDATDFTFLFAPHFHSGMRHAAVVRRQLSVRTVMNLLGPCVNPARPPVHLLGVADARMLRRVAQVLAALGVSRALVVHGAGLDEVALHAETRAVSLRDGTIEELVLTPEEAGFERVPLNALEGGDPADNAARLRALLEGGGDLAERQAVALNAGALLWTAGLAPSFADGAATALSLIDSGAPARTLGAFIEASNG